ncbi:hypothetical protein [Noviluteimonas gilva]|uniref:Uncharacterized protein n=1 Tax=Noviluteimonas gilva TaxID=2682097 RepID=A0A7C9HNJ0_9GAMM|nr:hypothetical protein [Lysobacter gilvus]MUV15277.1 hypothetical protein [Lysobacter gilvus]
MLFLIPSVVLGAGIFFGCPPLRMFCGISNPVGLFVFPLQLTFFAGWFGGSVASYLVYVLVAGAASALLALAWMRLKRWTFLVTYLVLCASAYVATDYAMYRALMQRPAEMARSTGALGPLAVDGACSIKLETSRDDAGKATLHIDATACDATAEAFSAALEESLDRFGSSRVDYVSLVGPSSRVNQAALVHAWKAACQKKGGRGADAGAAEVLSIYKDSAIPVALVRIFAARGVGLVPGGIDNFYPLAPKGRTAVDACDADIPLPILWFSHSVERNDAGGQ